jgi:hypothetical protein
MCAPPPPSRRARSPRARPPRAPPRTAAHPLMPRHLSLQRSFSLDICKAYSDRGVILEVKGKTANSKPVSEVSNHVMLQREAAALADVAEGGELHDEFKRLVNVFRARDQSLLPKKQPAFPTAQSESAAAAAHVAGTSSKRQGGKGAAAVALPLSKESRALDYVAYELYAALTRRGETAAAEACKGAHKAAMQEAGGAPVEVGAAALQISLALLESGTPREEIETLDDIVVTISHRPR